MAGFNGVGVFLLAFNWINDAAAGIKIRADRMQAQMVDFANGLTQCVTRDGQSPATANLPMGGYRHTNVDDAQLDNEYATYAQLKAGVLDAKSDFTNLVINSDFAINQRGYVTSAALAAGAFGHDRWKAGASGCTYAFTQAIVGTTVTITAGSLVQVIESRYVEGGDYTLSWNGTAQARINGGAYGTSPQSISSVTAGQNMTIEFNTGTVGKVRVAPGLSAIAYKLTPYAIDLANCQRYYQKSYLVNVRPNTVTTIGQVNYTAGAVRTSIFFRTEMRDVPAITLYSPKDGVSGVGYNISTALNVNMSASEAGTSNARIANTGTNNAGQDIAFHFTAESEI